MKTAALILGLVFSLAAVSFGQVRTVTNSSLERIQQKRLAAERDYRDNYKRMGFPSPEELERQQEADMTARLQLAGQLRQARLDKERLELERRSVDLDAARLDADFEANQVDGFNGGYFSGFGGYGGFNSGYGHRRSRRGHSLFGSYYPWNRLFQRNDRRGAYRVTPFEVIPVQSPQRSFGRSTIRGRRR